MRLDRLLALHVDARLRKGTTEARNSRIPILMYHSIADDTDDSAHAYYRTVTSRKVFEEHMALLHRLGFAAVTVSQALRFLASGDEFVDTPRRTPSPSPDSQPARPCVAITFDDGFADFYTHAFPVLARFGFRATVFVSTGFIEHTFINGRRCLRKRDIAELSVLGVEFGSHTVSHRPLESLPRDEIASELSDSKRSLEDIVGREIGLFSYPYAFPQSNPPFVQSLKRLLSRAGYSGGVTTVIGRSSPGDDFLFLPRLPMNDCDDAKLFEAKLNGAYDWMRFAQAARKAMSRLGRSAGAAARRGPQRKASRRV